MMAVMDISLDDICHFDAVTHLWGKELGDRFNFRLIVSDGESAEIKYILSSLRLLKELLKQNPYLN